MRILMIAPEPVFSPRGTPISVINRCRALTALGHEVDLVTYPMGENVAMPGLRYLRAPRIPGVRKVKIGPSLAKLPLDAAVFLKALAQVVRRRYDVIHTHEEAGAFAWLLHRVLRTPYVHDVHNGLGVVMTNYGFSPRHPLTRFADWLEARIVRGAATVIVVFPELLAMAQRFAPGKPAHLIYNVPLDPPANPARAAQQRQEWSANGDPLVVYTGTLEPYQGMPLLIEAMVHVQPLDDGRHPRLVVVGGRDDQVAELAQLAATHGVSDRITFTGLRPPAEIPTYLDAADVLVSTRSSGTNTPLKTYAYMHSGRPIVATRTLSHTQILDDGTALLVEPDPRAIAAGIDRALCDRELATRLGNAAQSRARADFSPESFVARTAAAYAAIGTGEPAPVAVADAVSLLERAA